jgi:hypothetical protein
LQANTHCYYFKSKEKLELRGLEYDHSIGVFGTAEVLQLPSGIARMERVRWNHLSKMDAVLMDDGEVKRMTGEPGL